MKMEFYEAYNALFSDSYKRLDRALKIKLKAMRYCQEFYDLQQKRMSKKRNGSIGPKFFDRISLNGPAEY